MAMSITNLMSSDGPSVYYTDSLRVTLESHMTYLREHPNTVMREVQPQLAHKYEYDFYGLLTAMGYPRHLHYVIMRMNDLDSPQAFRETTYAILVPDTTVVDAIVAKHRTSNRI